MIDITSFGSAFVTSLSLIGLAEMGDKSQLVCMMLASRHRAWPVLTGAVAAFALLNLLAVLFGAAVANWVSPSLVALIVGVLFIGFGINSLRKDDEEGETLEEKASRSVLISTFLLITVAEFGDKTQLAVAGLGSTLPTVAVWAGATLALCLTSALGVFAGRHLLQRIPVGLLHKMAGIVFILIGLSVMTVLL